MAKKVEHIPGTRAHPTYKTKDGTMVPGGSTIAKICDPFDGTKWGNSLGLQGIDVAKYVDKLAAVGTLTHAMCLEYYRTGAFQELFDQHEKWVVEKATNYCYPKFVDWTKGKTLEPIIMEQPLVSEMYGFGGTPDWYGKVDGVRTLIDYKTSKAIYQSHWFQLSGYNTLLFENGFSTDRIVVLRIGRSDEEGFDELPRESRELLGYWEVFEAALNMYWKKRRLKGGK